MGIGEGLPSPQWARDPAGRHEYRYWDGARWTDFVSDQGVITTDLPVRPPIETTVMAPTAAMTVAATGPSQLSTRHARRRAIRRRRSRRITALAGVAAIGLAAAALASSGGDGGAHIATSPTTHPSVPRTEVTRARVTTTTSTSITTTTLPPTTAPPATAAPATAPSAPPPAAQPAVVSPPPLSCPNGSYTNVDGNEVCSPYSSPSGPPPGATARCNDGTYSFAAHHQGACSSHGGVAEFYN